MAVPLEGEMDRERTDGPPADDERHADEAQLAGVRPPAALVQQRLLRYLRHDDCPAALDDAGYHALTRPGPVAREHAAGGRRHVLLTAFIVGQRHPGADHAVMPLERVEHGGQ